MNDIVIAENAPYVFKMEGNAGEEQEKITNYNDPQEESSTLLQQLKQMMVSDASYAPQQQPPPTVSCRLWVDCDDNNISYYYIQDKTAVHPRKYISNDHDLEKFHFQAGNKPTIFVWQRGDPSLSPHSLEDVVK
eukprot:scaffold18458_cov99-Amphora_coffeaeformis.AAC.1